MRGEFKRSRALWDEARDNGGLRAWISVICYEMQPIRFAEVTNNGGELVSSFQIIAYRIIDLISVDIPQVSKSLFLFVINRTFKQWMILGLFILYYYFVKWVHEKIDAGPFVVILTSLTLIFTIGLSDEKNSGISAYSVFNKGFEQLLGSIDVDSLLAQHIGGIGGMMMMGNNQNRNNNNINNNNGDENDQHNNRRGVEEDADENPNNNTGANDRRNINNDNDENNRSRKSGKKKRRDKKQEQRRRYESDGDENVIDGDDNEVMQRIIEEQVAENQM